MLFKEDKHDRWHTREWRYFCECRTPQHVLLFEENMEDEKADLMIYNWLLYYGGLR